MDLNPDPDGSDFRIGKTEYQEGEDTMSKGDRKMSANHSVHMSLKADNPDHVCVWEMIRDRDREKFPVMSDYIVDIMIRSQKKETSREEVHKDQEAAAERPGGMQGVDPEAWKKELLDEMEKRFRMILRGPVGR